uniref:Uncharacterized protein n=1 Tax=Nicotiana tabacum TaxID=4097 RepID=A0A1S4AZJ6_TOBAC|nr:PREDICTED: uncharacterized protein LOC107803016 [Nicotiana tabacum]
MISEFHMKNLWEWSAIYRQHVGFKRRGVTLQVGCYDLLCTHCQLIIFFPYYIPVSCTWTPTNVKLFSDFRAGECELVNRNRSPSQSSTVESSPAIMVENSPLAVTLDSSSLDLSIGGSDSLLINGVGRFLGVTPVKHMYYLEALQRSGVISLYKKSCQKTVEFIVDVGEGGFGESSSSSVKKEKGT